MEKVLCSNHPGSKVANLSCLAKYINRNNLKIDVRINLNSPISSIRTRGMIYYKYNTYQRVGGDVSIDICGWLNGESHFLLDWFLPKILKYTNLNHKCPYDGQVYFKANNISIDKFDYPSLLPAGRYRTDTIVFGQDDKIQLNFSLYFSISDHRINVEFSKL